MSRAIALGKSAAIATAIGNALGTFANVLVLAVGLGPILDNFPIALLIIRYVGAIYLIYLGIDSIRNRKQIELEDSSFSAASIQSTLRQGAIVGITNPKTIVFFAAVLPQFVISDFGYSWLQLLLLGLVFCLLGVTFDSIYGVSAGLLRDWFANSTNRLANLNSIGGVLIILLGIAVALGWF